MTIFAMCCESWSPMFVQVAPALVDLKIPVPLNAYPANRGWTSPVPTQTMLGFEGATAMSPTANADS